MIIGSSRYAEYGTDIVRVGAGAAFVRTRFVLRALCGYTTGNGSIGRISVKVTSCVSLLTALLTVSVSVPARSDALPDPTSTGFCQTVQQILSSTDRAGENTLFTDMPEYRHSKPSADPHRIYQVVTYAGQQPIMVSCKVKGAAHLRSAYGEAAAGEQLNCPEITRRVRTQAAGELRAAGNAEAARAAEAIVIDDDEPYITGQQYLSEFALSYRGDDGAIHVSSPGLFHDYDSWTTWILPARFVGQTYCHIATAAYIKALATGATEPGTMIGTGDDAPVTPE